MLENHEFDEAIEKECFPKLYEVLLGDREKLNEQLKVASLFVMAFECLKDYVEGQFRNFFCQEYKVNKNGILIPLEGDTYLSEKEKYQKQYQKLSKKLLNVKEKEVTIFQAGCAWFYDSKALNDDDFVLLSSCLRMRNDFAHELYKWLTDDKYPSLDKGLVNAPINLHFKLSNWWVRNVEAGIAPEDYEKFNEEEMGGAMSLNVQILLQMYKKALPEIEDLQ